MLKPIKNFITYLQKNANGSAIFGLTPTTMGPNEEPTTATLDEAVATTVVDGCGVDEEDGLMPADELNCDDPLYDPLALDDAACGSDLNVSCTSSIATDLDTSAQITLVDVTSLKNSPIRRDSGEENISVVVNGGESVNISVNGQVGSETSPLVNGHGGGDETKSTILGDDSFTTASTGGTPNVTINGQCIASGNGEVEFTVADGVPAVATGTEAAATTQGTPRQREEEEASDGSDSGLGSEPSRNLVPSVVVKSNLKRRSAEDAPTTDVSSEKRPKKGITFDGVTVFYFTRMQGFGCVPSQGGCTLGMEFQHMHSRRFTLAEHAAEQRKMHRAQLQELNGARSSSSEETDSEEEPSESGSEAESESYGFLQPVTTRQRRALLKAAGVRKIDSTEKDECRVIRTSREVCGCTCRGYCDPDTCACSQAGIKCQVDRPNFPCGCTQDGCANVVGRVEFNPARVRTHFIHTIMRLNLENKASEDQKQMSGGSSYGSGKDWSSGPVRLPGLYGMMGGGGAVEQVDSYHQQPQYGHQGYQGAESLDLHYAFRDYYGTGAQQQPQPVVNDQLTMMSSYYGNYATPLDQYHQPHHPGLDQRQPDPHSSYHGQQQQQPLDSLSTAVIIDEDTTLNTPINPNFVCDDPPQPEPTSTPTTALSSQLSLDASQPSQDPLDSSSSFIDLNSPLAAPSSDRLEAINDLLASSRASAVNAVVKRSLPEEDDELSDFRDPPVMPTVVIDCDAELSQDDTQEGECTVVTEEVVNPKEIVPADKVVETSENLSEIIKNSIVETVSN
uniref:Cysteine/serine-rich nuclear protein 3 n=1 Tax=Culex pipiens TaxID=7175 RepID=A0A8D8BI59_CULPI